MGHGMYSQNTKHHAMYRGGSSEKANREMNDKTIALDTKCTLYL